MNNIMHKLIAQFPANITEAFQIASEMKYQKPANAIHNIVVCGMGGSGIGAKLAVQWTQDELKIPVIFLQDYYLPHFVNENSLVIGSSYSGNTEESLETIQKAHMRGAHIVGVCSGGKLAAFCKENGFDCAIVPNGNQPRAAVAFSLIQILNLFFQLKFIQGNVLESVEMGRRLIVAEATEIQEEAKKLAEFLKDKVIAIYATSAYEAVAIRAKQQFNENGKLLCWQHLLPEMNHNELVAWGGGDNRFGALFLETNEEHPQNVKRMQFTKDYLKTRTDFVYTLNAKGNSTVERSIYFINVVDWASYYLSELKGIDVNEIVIVKGLKKFLEA
jgi:glucose/mannose-6-phosphate isomerase